MMLRLYHNFNFYIEKKLYEIYFMIHKIKNYKPNQHLLKKKKTNEKRPGYKISFGVGLLIA